ncbi:MAG TPA: hypothetical protein VG186_09100 [Solirubrobacteraceae bacterium]|jgi:hypothetical protein|nr:hypothetical protein [Solirubrobacteraceae bacterium]
MTKRVCVLLVCAFAFTALVSGCGGGQAKTGPTSGLSLTTIKRLNKANTDRSVAACHAEASNTGLQANVKQLVLTECEYIRTGNNAGLRTVGRQICKLQAQAQPEPIRSTMLAKC